MSSAWVDLQEAQRAWKIVTFRVEPYEHRPDTQRVWWRNPASPEHTFPVSDPITGMPCWHHMVRVDERVSATVRDIFVDTNLSFAVYSGGA